MPEVLASVRFFASGGIGNVGFVESLCRAAMFDWFMGR